MSVSNPINHSVCRWAYADIPLEDFCVAAKGMGIGSIELLETSDFATIRAHHPHFSHYHTGGCPGRHEIDETQELRSHWAIFHDKNDLWIAAAATRS